MAAEGVRVVCGRCVFKGDTFRTQNALQVVVGQYDCGRCAAQKHTFRKSIGDLPQKKDFGENNGQISSGIRHSAVAERPSRAFLLFLYYV